MHRSKSLTMNTALCLAIRVFVLVQEKTLGHKILIGHHLRHRSTSRTTKPRKHNNAGKEAIKFSKADIEKAWSKHMEKTRHEKKETMKPPHAATKANLGNLKFSEDAIDRAWAKHMEAEREKAKSTSANACTIDESHFSHLSISGINSTFFSGP